ncbi:hypothetical protein COLO4_37759 [Corchorus olitorius]|uniref:Uncharacterized protein n=1 Tax=Corchorus olitorius TaxID=93759 RepID=A0A1R3FZK3_9ROSI|nr:hypothetical protein COLO4_37759 [Corchorus olitorius]
MGVLCLSNGRGSCGCGVDGGESVSGEGTVVEDKNQSAKLA